MAQIGRPEGDRQGGDRGDGGQCAGVTLHRRPLDRAAVVHGAALINRLLHQLVDQPRRMGLRPLAGGRFNRADDRRFEPRVALLEVHRHLRVRDPPTERPHQAVQQQADEHRDDDDPEGDDGGCAEPERLQARGGEEQRQHRAGDHHHCASQREAAAPAIPHPTNDVDQLRAWVHCADSP